MHFVYFAANVTAVKNTPNSTFDKRESHRESQGKGVIMCAMQCI